MWKILIIILSFYTSFTFAYLATFRHVMEDSVLWLYDLQDMVYTSIFIVDMAVHYIVKEATKS